MPAQMSLLSGIVLDMYAMEKGRDVSEAADRLTQTLADRQSAMREQTINDVRELLKRLRNTDQQEG